MVDRLYWKEAYMKEFNAEITAIDGAIVQLDRTAFYPTGGGQLNDTGTISANGVERQVVDVKKNGELILHALNSSEGFSIGDKVSCKLDWERRYSLMKYHTSVHLISAILARHQPDVKFTGGMIYVDKAHADFDCPLLNRELAVKIIEEAQAVIEEGHAVNSRFLTQEEANLIPNLIKTQPGEDIAKGLEKIRVVEIEGVDLQADGGTHVVNTKEIGRITLAKFDNKGAHRKRIEIKIA